jgi:hypothetical protein
MPSSNHSQATSAVSTKLKTRESGIPTNKRIARHTVEQNRIQDVRKDGPLQSVESRKTTPLNVQNQQHRAGSLLANQEAQV